MVLYVRRVSHCIRCNLNMWIYIICAHTVVGWGRTRDRDSKNATHSSSVTSDVRSQLLQTLQCLKDSCFEPRWDNIPTQIPEKNVIYEQSISSAKSQSLKDEDERAWIGSIGLQRCEQSQAAKASLRKTLYLEPWQRPVVESKFMIMNSVQQRTSIDGDAEIAYRSNRTNMHVVEDSDVILVHAFVER
jgi:hypothetical protein